jgi:hypothetical protein
MDFPDRLYQRARLQPDFDGQTSDTLLHEVLDYVWAHRERGEGIIEVGCYRGNSSLLLGYLCGQLHWPFHIVDVDLEYLDYVRELLTAVGLHADTHFHHGTFGEFSADVDLSSAPVLVFIDGDHRYAGVGADIQTLFRLNRRPYCAIFHDFSLRYRTEMRPDLANVQVDEAILDSLGRSLLFKRMGLQFPNGTIDSPTPGETYWKRNGSEAVAVELAGLRVRDLPAPVVPRPGVLARVRARGRRAIHYGTEIARKTGGHRRFPSPVRRWLRRLYIRYS